MSTQKKATSGNSRKFPDFGAKAIGSFEVTINNEPLHLDGFWFSRDSQFTWLSAATPLEGMLLKNVTFFLPPDIKPGTYKLGQPEYYGALNYWQDSGSGEIQLPIEFATLRGTITLDEINDERPRIKGSFEFHAWGFGHLLPCAGDFDMQNER